MKKKDVKVGSSYVFSRRDFGGRRVMKVTITKACEDVGQPGWFGTDNKEIPFVNHKSLVKPWEEHAAQVAKHEDYLAEISKQYRERQDRQRGPALEGMRVLLELLTLGGSKELGGSTNMLHGAETLERALSRFALLEEKWDPSESQVMLHIEDVIAIGIGMKKKGELS